MLAHWFVLDTLLLANKANREGMHANALAQTRQSVEEISIIKLGICGHPEAEAVLLKWDSDKLTLGKRKINLSYYYKKVYRNSLQCARVPIPSGLAMFYSGEIGWNFRIGVNRSEMADA